MAFLYRPRSTKPAGQPLNLDPQNPLARGLVSCLPFSMGAGNVIDVVLGNKHIDAALSTTWAMGPSGWLANTWQMTNASTTDLAFTAGSFSVGVFFNVQSLAGLAQVVGRSDYTSESVNSGWVLQVSPSLYAWSVFKNNASSVYELDSVTASSLGDHTLVGTSDGVNRRNLYLDGYLEGTKTGNAVCGSSAAGIYCNQNAGPVPSYLVCVWNRVLTPFEVLSFHRNPWQIFQGATSGIQTLVTGVSLSVNLTGASITTVAGSLEAETVGSVYDIFPDSMSLSSGFAAISWPLNGDTTVRIWPSSSGEIIDSITWLPVGLSSYLYTLTVTTAPGQSIRDHPGVLYYDSTRGVAIKPPTAVDIEASCNIVFDGLQFNLSNCNGTFITDPSLSISFTNCIVQLDAFANGYTVNAIIAQFVNCLILDLRSASGGTSYAIQTNGQPQLTNTTMVTNANGAAGTLFASGISPYVISNLIVAGYTNPFPFTTNLGFADHCVLTSSGFGSASNMSDNGGNLFSQTASSIFVNPVSNFRLKAGSPAIDVGATASVPAEDIFRSTRPYGVAWDIGANENTDLSLTLSGAAISDSAGTAIPRVSGKQTGVQSASGVGTLAARVDDNVAVTGVQMAAAVGSLSVQAGANVAVTGAAIATSAGAVAGRSDENLTLTGAAVTSASGTLTGNVTSSYNQQITGTQAAGGVGAFTVQATSNYGRASIATYFDATGTMQTAPTGVLRSPAYDPVDIGSIGTLLEGAQTNLIRNPRGEGAVVGSPGTFPTNWSAIQAAGLTRQIVGRGNEDGIPYTDIRYSGTANATIFQIITETTSGIAQVSGQQLTSSVYLRLVGGDWTGFATTSGLCLEIIGYNNVGGALTTGGSTSDPAPYPTSAPLRTQRYAVSACSVNAALVSTSGVNIRVNPVNGGVIDFTLRIGAPQTESITLTPTNYCGLLGNGWLQSNIVQTNFQPDPIGTNTAIFLTDTSTVGTHFIAQASGAVANNQQLTYSVYAKDGGRRYMRFQIFDSTNSANQLNVTFDLSNGTIAQAATYQGVATNGSVGISPTGGGWYRCWISALLSNAVDTTVTCRMYLYNAFNGLTYGDGTGLGHYFWGCQLEVGTAINPCPPTGLVNLLPTSNILPAIGSPATSTRAADILSLSGTISGVAATSGVGSPIANELRTLTGVAATSGVGTLAKQSTISLIGVQGASSASVLTPSESRALTGVATTSATGSLGVTSALSFTGASATSATGVLAVAESVALTGATIATQAGTISRIDLSVPLSGAAITSAANSLVAATGVAVTGAEVATQAGSLSVRIDVSLPATVTASATSAIIPQPGVALVGASIASAAGTASKALVITLGDAPITAIAGAIQYGNNWLVPVTGAVLVTHAGDIVARIDKLANLSGAAISCLASTMQRAAVDQRIMLPSATIVSATHTLVPKYRISLGGAIIHTGASSPTILLSSTGFVMTDLAVTMTNLPDLDNSIGLSWSDDKGATYGHTVERSLGNTGEYLTSVKWQRLGMGRDRVFKLEWSAPALTALAGAFIDTDTSQS